MNGIAVLNLIGLVVLFSSLFMIAPLAVSFLDAGRAFYAIGISFLLTLGSGALMYFPTRRGAAVEIKHRDGFAVVTLSWLAISFFGALPYAVYGVTQSFTDAYFESMAGFTTTGATILGDIESVPRGILLWRSLTQWIGGMGIIVFSLAILPMLGAGGMQLFKAEVPEIGVEKLKPRILDTAKSLWYIYAGLTAALSVLLFLSGMGPFDAVCHSLTTLSTGGFSTKNESIAYFNGTNADIFISIFMFLAGINFTIHFYVLRGNIRKLIKSSELKFYCSVIILAVTAVTLSLEGSVYHSFPAALRHASFQVISIMTTTGFSTANYKAWSVFVQMLLLSLMFFGGMIGSTGGGMKQVRVLLMLKQAYRELYHLIHPHAFTALKLDEKNVDKETLGSIWGFLFLFILIASVSTLGITALGKDIVTSSSAVISAMSNVGPALGEFGPSENYTGMPSAGKWILIFCMLIGRLEIYTVIILFVPHFWKK